MKQGDGRGLGMYKLNDFKHCLEEARRGRMTCKNVCITNLIMARGEFLGGLEMAQKGIVGVEPKRIFIDGKR